MYLFKQKQTEQTYDEEEIEKVFPLKENYSFSKLTKEETKELFNLLNHYYLTLREKLNLKPYTTFGLEIEFENLILKNTKALIKKSFPTSKWTLRGDTTLKQGAEVNTPILRDSIETWQQIEKICKQIKNFAEIGTNSGGHIHVGVQILEGNLDYWLNFIYLWSIYENIIFRFSYGEFAMERPMLKSHAQPIAKEFNYVYQIFSEGKNELDLDDFFNLTAHQKYKAVNFDHIMLPNLFAINNTIEFRCPNGTLNPVIWQNNLNLFINLLEYSKNQKFNKDILDKRKITTKDKYNNLEYYNEIDINQALELCDLIFKTNKEKLYFLRQYLKSFDTSNKFIKVKEFTKKSRP